LRQASIGAATLQGLLKNTLPVTCFVLSDVNAIRLGTFDIKPGWSDRARA
jgi:hypothetical protein